MPQTTDSAPAGSSSGLALVCWIVVSIPLLWGVSNSINSSLPLFGGTSAYIPWIIGAPPKPTASPAAKSTPAPVAAPTATAAPTMTPAATPEPTASATVAPSPEASPFSTAQPSATAAPIDTPAVPKP